MRNQKGKREREGNSKQKEKCGQWCGDTKSRQYREQDRTHNVDVIGAKMWKAADNTTKMWVSSKQCGALHTFVVFILLCVC